MPARRILELGDPMLRVVSPEVSRSEDIRLIIRDLRSTLRAFGQKHRFGRGISAIQIGEPKRIIYLEVEARLEEAVDVRSGKFESIIHPAVQRVTATQGERTPIVLINPDRKS